MIVKVFKAAKSFAGVNYNERKNENGKSELLVAENFSILKDHPTRLDYISYMNLVCNTNPAVKNVQFHATISCKGKEYSVEQLKDVAIMYVEKMGYSKNPYLIYFHSDTDNNHVHIVSTRVNKEGVRMNDKMEGVRSRKILDEIMHLNLSEKASNDIMRSMDYNFSTQAQFKLLLESSGWKLREKDDNIRLFSSCQEYGSISLQNVTEHTKNYKPDEKRIKQLAAIFHKYSQAMDCDTLTSYIKLGFGIDLKFHIAKGHSFPYGYTVIDHSTKSVFKGSEIYPLNSLLKNPIREKKIQVIPSILESLCKAEPYITTNLLKHKLGKLGYSLKDNQIYLKGDKLSSYSMSSSLYEALQYNDRLYAANKYSVSSESCITFMSELHNVNEAHIHANITSDISVYKDAFLSYMKNSSDARTAFHDSGIYFYRKSDSIYILDSKNKTIIDMHDIGIGINDLSVTNKPIIIKHSDNVQNEKSAENKQTGRENNVASAIFSILEHNDQYIQEDSNRRRRKRGQQQN